MFFNDCLIDSIYIFTKSLLDLQPIWYFIVMIQHCVCSFIVFLLFKNVVFLVFF